ncbi:leucine rich repeat variant [Acidithrix ferrooxidans]|uniref:Leucine rich repeat variant n=2 Tax=Acidithrix ferrooxidans TaxID=1280514 RepID=A0A0D8HEZ9_9ACTN|nr:leucine rich repeat variant [Acidithrix ferrooxidans]
MKCYELWDTDCDLNLSREHHYRCRMQAHSTNDVINRCLDAGFTPNEVKEVLSINADIPPDNRVYEFLTTFSQGRAALESTRKKKEIDLEALARINNAKYLCEIASSRYNTVETLNFLAQSPHRAVRVAVAGNPNTPPETLVELYLESTPELRGFLAENPATPKKYLERIFKRDKGSAERRLAKNPSVPGEILEAIIATETADTKITIANNPGAELQLQFKLAEDADWRVRYALGRSVFAKNEVIVKLATDPLASVRSAIALNPRTPHPTMLQLLEEEDYVVRYRLAQNSALPLPIFTKIIDDRDSSVRRISTTNSHSPFYYIPEEMADAIENQPNYAWVSFLSNEQIPESIRHQLRNTNVPQTDVAINEFSHSHPSNIALFAELIARNKYKTSLHVKFTLTGLLCRHPKLTDEIEELTISILEECDYSESIRLQLRQILISNFHGEHNVIQALLRRTVAA